jgi:hypothetical protein
MENALMLLEQKMLKEPLLLSGTDTTEPTKDGRFFMLTKHQRIQPRDSTKNSVSISTDHSTWSQDFQCTELPKLLEPAMLLSRDTSREELLRPGSSTTRTRPSEATTGRTIAWKSNPTVDLATLE